MAVCLVGLSSAAGAEKNAGVSVSISDGAAQQTVTETTERGPDKSRHVEIVQSISRQNPLEFMGSKSNTWLGISTQEAPEVLAQQLELPPGCGLVVTYVSPESPAAKAGLKKNDLLVEFEGQNLVHPEQLRKLVHVRDAGQEIKLSYYRGGKKAATTVVLENTRTLGLEWINEEKWTEHLKDWQKQLQDLPNSEAFRQQIDKYKDSWQHMNGEQKRIQTEIKRSLEGTQKALKEALSRMTNLHSILGEEHKVIEKYHGTGIDLAPHGSVTIKSTEGQTKSVVKTDDSGTYVIVANPQKHLTVHAKDGKLLFDGKIETEEQRAQVPADILKKIKPLLDKIDGPGRKPLSEDRETDELEDSSDSL